MNNGMVLCRWTNGKGGYLAFNTHRGLPFIDGTTDNFVYEVTFNKENAITFEFRKELIEACKNTGERFYPEEVCEE